MMNQIVPLLIIVVLFYSCKDSNKIIERKDNRIYLKIDTINVVKMTDTMVISESTCRGCAYEQSTNFSISDSTGIVELHNVETYDSNNDAKEQVAGGSISKTLVIVPKKAGNTKIKLYKFWKMPANSEDSANFTSYTIEVRD